MHFDLQIIFLFSTEDGNCENILKKAKLKISDVNFIEARLYLFYLSNIILYYIL